MRVKFQDVHKALVSKNYKIFTRINELNIVGIRRIVPNVKNKFDDLVTVFFTVPLGTPWNVTPVTELFYDKRIDKTWVFSQYPATTEPGKSYLLNPINKKGTAILTEGQYEAVYKIDKHNGKYEALCQRLGNVTVWRDSNKDTEYDFKVKEAGMFGINIHRANQWNILEWIDKNSAGCQVIQSPKHFNELMGWAKLHEHLYENVFTYTLISENDLQ